MAVKFLLASVWLTLMVIQVSSNVIRESEVGLIREGDEPIRSVPAFDVEQGLDGIYSDDVTSKRPDINDIFGGIFQNLVKAPGQIATRVQGILERILQRPTTTPKTSYFQ